MRQDWLQTAEEAVQRAREARSLTSSTRVGRQVVERGDVVTLVKQSVLPNGRRHNPALSVEASNICDAAIIAAAQGEAQVTGQRESFMLPDGSIGSVDANGTLYDERPPQG